MLATKHFSVLLTWIALAAAFSSCYTYQVSKFDPDNDTNGLPFYALQQIPVDETAYDQSWLVATLNVKLTGNSTEDPNHYVGSHTRTILGTDLGTQTDLASLFLGGTVSNDEIRRFLLYPNIQAPMAMSQQEVEKLLQPVATRTRIVTVPSRNRLSINSRVPFGGETNNSFKFTSNGTLTEASADSKDSLPGTIVQAVASIVGATTGKKATAAAAADLNYSVIYSVTLSVKTSHRYYVHRKETWPKPKRLNEGWGDSISEVDVLDSWTFQVVEGNKGPFVQDTADSGTTATKPGDAIEISGTIKLPKSAGGAPPAAPASGSQPPPKK